MRDTPGMPGWTVSRAQDRLFRDLQLDRRVDHGWPDRPDELLEPAAARDDRRLHRGRLPDLRHQRARARAGGPRAVPRRPRGQAALSVLPVLRPAGRLTAAQPSPPVLISSGRQPRLLLLQHAVPGDDARWNYLERRSTNRSTAEGPI